MNKSVKYAAICLIAVAATVGLVAAATTLISPQHVIGSPTTSPSPSPSASASPSPSPTIMPTAITLTSNLTVPFYIGDTLHLVAQLNIPVAGVTVTLYNNGEPLISGGSAVTATTNTDGVVVFDRKPTLTFDYHVVATLP